MEDQVICTSSFHILNTISKESIKYDEDIGWNKQHDEAFAKLFSDLKPQRKSLVVQHFPISTDKSEAPPEKKFKSAPMSPIDKHYLGEFKSFGLYYELLGELRDSKVLAARTVDMFEKNPQKAFIQLLKFFVDLAGYQNVRVDEVYKFEGDVFEILFKIMQRRTITCAKSDCFLLQGTSSQAFLKVYKLVCSFVALLIHYDKKMLIYKYNYPNNLIRFVRLMGLNCVREFYSCGYLVAMNMLTEYCRAMHYHKKMLEKDAIDTAVEELVSAHEQIITCLLDVITKNRLSKEDQFKYLRQECAKEIWMWFKFQVFESSECATCLNYLYSLFDENSVKVRLTALNTCHNLVQSEALHKYIVPSSDTLIQLLGQLIGSIHVDISWTVITIFISLLNRCPKIIYDEKFAQYRNKIFCRMLSRNYRIAHAAGCFFIGYIRHCKSELDPAYMLVRRIINIFSITEFYHGLPLVVEAVIDCTPEIQNWLSLVDLLLSCEVNDEHAVYLIQFIYHATYQMLKGKTVREKRQIRKGNARLLLHQSIVSNFVAYFPNMLIKFKDNNKFVVYLVQILTLVNYSNVKVEKEFPGSVILSELADLFWESNDPLTVKYASKAIIVLSRSGPLTLVADRFILYLKDQTIKLLHDIRCYMDEDDTLAQRQKLIQSWIQINCLMSNTSINARIKLGDIYEHGLNLKCLHYQISCCNWYLTSYLRSLAKSNDRMVNNLIEQASAYVVTLFNFLDPAMCTKNRQTLFAILDVHSFICSKLGNKKLLNVESEALGKIVYAFKNNVLYSPHDDLRLRRFYLNTLLKRITDGVIPVNPAKIMKDFNLYYKQYGDIMIESFREIKENSQSQFIVLVFCALKGAFKIHSNFRESGPLQIRNLDEFNETAKYLDLHVAKTCEEKKTICLMGVKYVCDNPNDIDFLYCLKHFTGSLNKQDLWDMSVKLQSSLPFQYQKCDAFRSIITVMGNKTKLD